MGDFVADLLTIPEGQRIPLNKEGSIYLYKPPGSSYLHFVSPRRTVRWGLTAPGPEDPPLIFDCAASVSVGDWVATGASDNEVILADASSIGNPAIGLVSSKPTTTTARLLTAGPASGFSGLSSKDRLFLSKTAGEYVVNQNWNPLPGGYKIIQRLGTAKNATTIIISLRIVIEIE